MFVGEPLKAWGRLVSLPDPEPDQPKAKGKTTAMARGGRKGHKRMFVGNLEPLLVARKRRKNYNRRRRSASPPSDPRNAGAGDDGDEGGNLDDNDADADADADGDPDDGVWPGEFVVPTIVVTEPDAELRITPEEVERAIGAAFAIGTAA